MKKITVMGLGLNQGGVGVVKFLAKAGAYVLVTDLKKESELTPSIQILKNYPRLTFIFGKHREKDFIETDLIVKNPAVSNNNHYLEIARKHRVPIETDLSLFLELCPSKDIIAVTGTKGKGTTASLIYQIFKKAKKDACLAGNIGISVFDVLPNIKKQTIVVLEISSFQLEGLKEKNFSPHVAVVTNIFPDHLNRYKNLKEYIETKKIIFKNQRKKDFLVLNYDNEITRCFEKEIKSKILWFSPVETCHSKSLHLPGKHNLYNLSAAIGVAKIYRIPKKAIQKAVENFKALPHHLQFVKEIKGVKFYNDSAATTPEACSAGISSFNQPIILILGGKDKNLSYEKLIEDINKFANIFFVNGLGDPSGEAERKKYCKLKIKKIVLLQHPEYDASRKIKKLIIKYRLTNKLITVKSMKDAVEKAYQAADANDVILFSPACASFGMFQNEFDRGNQFIKYVNQLNELYELRTL